MMDIEKLKMESKDLLSENIEKVAELFPNCLVESEEGKKIDFDLLRQELSGDIVDGPRERYHLDFPGKREAIVESNKKITKTLRPIKDKSVNFDTTKNIYIEGDNLEALKILQESYLGKIKCIYIDPPYNTGNDFVYNDDFSHSEKEELERQGRIDENGNVLTSNGINNESNGRYHSDWLKMMYPRLKLARNLLSDDGVIFISIDDNEVDNLRKICDEVFGQNQFLAEFPRVTKRGGKSTDTYAKNHDYFLSFCKDISKVNITGLQHIDEGFKYEDKYINERGKYKLNQTLDYNTLQYNKTMDYKIEINDKVYVPGGDITKYKERHEGKHNKHDWVWRWSKKLFDFGLKNDWIEISKTGRIYTKTYLNATIEKDGTDNYFIKYKERNRAISSIEFVENVYSNDNSNKEITNIMNGTFFEYVKPTNMIKMIMNSCTNQYDIILDFFSGSATTAHAVMKLNAEDGGNRQFIMVQLPEATDENSEAYKAGFKNICDIGEERIRRAGKKILEEMEDARSHSSPIQVDKNGSASIESKKAVGAKFASPLDIGFRVYKIDDSNMKDIYYKPDEIDQKSVLDYISNVKEDRTALDLLTQVMLNLGLIIDLKIEEKKIYKNLFYFVEDNALVACFDDKIDLDSLSKALECKPLKIVCKESSFEKDQDKINFNERIKKHSPETEKYII